jgi:TRAP-type mannitol/chloroaromatic compound transport system permease large subunit
VFLPIRHSVIERLKYAPAWVGALIAVNLQTAYMSPPVAMAPYYLKAVPL